MFEQLFELKALSTLLDIEVADVGAMDLTPDPTLEKNSREALLLAHISTWRPKSSSSVSLEREFAEFLLHLLNEEPRLRGAGVLRHTPFAGVDVPFNIDFLLSWPTDNVGVERIGVEFVRLQSRAIFFYKVSQVLPLGRTVILVIYGTRQMIEHLHDDIARLGLMNQNIKVVTLVDI